MKYYTVDDHLRERLKDPAFKKVWEEGEPAYQIACKIIEKRLKSKLSQRALAKKLGTSQAAIARLESMNGNPTLSFLKRIAKTLDAKLVVQFK